MREHFASGVAHALAGRGEEALADFDFVTRSLSQVSDGWYNRGVALTMLARPAEALAAFDAAIRLEDEDADTWDGRGSALAALSRFDEAVQAYDRALRLAADRADYWVNRGHAHLAAGHFWQAVEAFDRAGKGDPALQFQHGSERAATRSAIAADWAVMMSLAGREAFLPEPARSKCMACKCATACDAADLPR